MDPPAGEGIRGSSGAGRLAIWRSRGDSLSSDQRAMVINVRQVFALVADRLDVPQDVKAMARNRLAQVDRELDALEGRARGLAARRALRHKLGRIRNALLPALIWHRNTPAEVAAAFPDLDWGCG